MASTTANACFTCTMESAQTPLRDPEAGEGMRYDFLKNIRIKAGTHKLVIALPSDDLALAREITLSEERNTLTLEPVYGEKPGKQRPGFYGIASFTEGIKGFRVILNGKTFNGLTGLAVITRVTTQRLPGLSLGSRFICIRICRGEIGLVAIESLSTENEKAEHCPPSWDMIERSNGH